MGRYIIRRLLGVVVLLVIITLITFLIFFLVPANPAQQACGRACNPERIEIIKEKLGLNEPLYKQVGLYFKGIVVGRDYGTGADGRHCGAPCFGYSFATDQPVGAIIKDRAPVTFSIAIGAAVLWLIFGLTVGIISALRKGTILDRAAMTVALAGVSLPIYFTGLIALYFLSAKFQVLPFPRYVPFTDDPLGWAENLLMPWVTVAFLNAALYARLTRANMLETMGEDYIRTARAKGLPERRVVAKHGLRAALTPIVTIFGLDLGALLGGAVLTEQVFGLPGLGKEAVMAVFQLNQPVLLGVTIFAAFFIIIANLVVDIVYAFLDPKVRFG